MRFWWGVLAGVGGVWAYHHFVKPLPGAATG
jgi:hypothetical protein